MTADPKSVDGKRETARFARLGFEEFKRLATDETLSEHEKMGFPEAFRADFDSAIWEDVRRKLSNLDAAGTQILDVGSGCGPLARRLIAQAETKGQRLMMVDHREMLDQIPDSPVLTKRAGRFPEDVRADDIGGFDAILIYSVLQIVIVDANPFAFLDAALGLLRPGGQLLVGDIPNISKLRRFLVSEAGVEHHKAYMRTDAAPDIAPFSLPEHRIDDGLLIGLLLRARAAGFDAYLVPQPPDLPLANRREDLLIVRP